MSVYGVVYLIPIRIVILLVFLQGHLYHDVMASINLEYILALLILFTNIYSTATHIHHGKPRFVNIDCAIYN